MWTIRRLRCAGGHSCAASRSMGCGGAAGHLRPARRSRRRAAGHASSILVTRSTRRSSRQGRPPRRAVPRPHATADQCLIPDPAPPRTRAARCTYPPGVPGVTVSLCVEGRAAKRAAYTLGDHGRLHNYVDPTTRGDHSWPPRFRLIVRSSFPQRQADSNATRVDWPARDRPARFPLSTDDPASLGQSLSRRPSASEILRKACTQSPSVLWPCR
jgi:hypothetical protein